MFKSETRHRMLSILLLLAGACQASSGLRPDEDGYLLLANGTHIRGRIEAASILIPAGAEVFADGDLELHASDTVELAGVLRLASAVPNTTQVHGVDCEIRAGQGILVTGRVLGGMGRSFAGLADELCVGLAGGRGSSIHLAAPVVWAVGRLESGAGGSGGPAADGGDGGALWIESGPVSPDLLGPWSEASASDPEPGATFVSNAGGMGGMGLLGAGPELAKSGDSGDGGDVVHTPLGAPYPFGPWPLADLHAPD